jgi:hypothetical protein
LLGRSLRDAPKPSWLPGSWDPPSLTIVTAPRLFQPWQPDRIGGVAATALAPPPPRAPKLRGPRSVEDVGRSQGRLARCPRRRLRTRPRPMSLGRRGHGSACTLRRRRKSRAAPPSVTPAAVRAAPRLPARQLAGALLRRALCWTARAKGEPRSDSCSEGACGVSPPLILRGAAPQSARIASEGDRTPCLTQLRVLASPVLRLREALERAARAPSGRRPVRLPRAREPSRRL